MIDFTPAPIAIQLGPLPVYWYGICYALGLLAAYQVMVHEARRRGLDSEIIINGLIVVAVAALIGGRLYHVIDQWVLYKDDPITILLPIRRGAGGGYVFAGFSGLGVYGGPAHRHDRRLAVRPLEAAVVLALGRRRGAGPLRDAGDRAVRQLLQPGAVRAADDAAVGDRDPVQEPGRRVRLSARLGSERDPRAALPPAVPVRVALGGRRAGLPAVARSTLLEPAARR